MTQELVKVAFKFELNVKVFVAMTPPDRSGVIVGRAEYLNAEPSYLVRMRNGAGDMAEVWVTENALQVAQGT